MIISEIDGIPDYKEIIDLINAEWPAEFGDLDDEAKVREMIKSHIVEADTTKYLMEGNQIIGFYRYTRWPREEEKTLTAHTLDIALLPEKQHRGLGTLLMKDLIADCRRKGFTSLLSRSFKSNKGSIRLHQSLGFSLYRETDESLVWEISL